VYPKTDPLLIRHGDRVRIEMVNQTMMWHPMHLHGHFFRVLQGAGERAPLKHTVNVPPRETVRIEFTADNPGQWIFHCHNLYHLEAGMARVFEYET
jgi:FtsP/CotA-like multicopper oxidase with cupredoxin domain